MGLRRVAALGAVVRLAALQHITRASLDVQQAAPSGSGGLLLNTTAVTIDPAAPGLRFDGHGGLSAGGSSRLLVDYAEPYRSQILDYLYLPKFGASLQVCKVEIGGDTQATDGTEPSHMHSRDDLNCTRGYEFWLMKEALQRNPKMVTYGLIWGAPGWINNQTGFYGPDMLQYQLNWLRCAKDTHGIDVDWLGLWNERPDNFDYLKSLKKALLAENMTTQIVIGDNRRFNAPAAMQQFGHDAEFLAAFGAAGIHYPCGRTCGQAMTDAGKACWASEDLWTQPSWGGSVCWATEFNKNFILSNMTSTLSWATLWSAYPNVDVFAGSGDPNSGDNFWGPGLLYAWQPWSGHYALPPTVWASAHTTQFSEVGWNLPFSGAGSMASGGSYLTLISPNRSDFTIVVETASATCHRCRGFSWPAEVPQVLTIEVPAGMAAALTQLAVWATNETHQFFQLPSLRPANYAAASRHGATTKFSLLVQPQSLYTISTTTGQQKGAHPLPPASAAFPASWSDDFDTTPDETLAKYFADQCGSFQVMPQLAPAGRGKSLRQRVTQQPGVNSWNGNLLNPLTLIGDANAATNVYEHTAIGVGIRLQMPPDELSTAAAPPPPAPPAVALDPPSPMFVAHANNRLFGRGYWQITGNFTLAEAEAKCLSEPQCKAFTMESPTLPGPSDSIMMWLTADVDFFASNGWQTYVLNGTHPPTPPPPVPPPPLKGAWGGLCGRVMAVGENNGRQAGVQSGVCLQVNASSASGGASYRLLEDGMTVLASGHLPGCKAVGTWLSVEMTFVGQNVSVSVNKEQVATATVKAIGGMAALGCGWHIAEFEEFVISNSRNSLAGVQSRAAPVVKSDDPCATVSLAGAWLRINSSNATIEYTVTLLPGANSTYAVTSSAFAVGVNDTIAQGPDFVQFVSGAINPDATQLGESAAVPIYGRTLGGGQCDVLRWIGSKQSSFVDAPPPPAAAVALDPPSPTFVAHANNRLFGRGYWQITGNFTLAEAEAKCLSEPQCKAFTMESPTLPGPSDSIMMWLTADVDFFASNGWQTYVLDEPYTDHPTDSAWHRKGSQPHSIQAPALPTQQQLDYQARELTQFMHFSISTMAPINCSNGTRCVVKEQNCLDANDIGSGNGDHVWNASLFNPELLDTDQWVATAVEWGAKEICLTAKHTGGFTLWPTNALNGTYNYSVKYAPWKDGKGDVLREFTDSCRKYGVLPCFYFIADWNCVDEKTLDIPTYKSMIWTMVHELLTDYGTISRLWFDVFPSGPSNWDPGGFPQEYHDLVAYVREISPDTMLLSGSDGCMAGHEKGYSGYPLFHGQGIPNSLAGEMCSNDDTGLWYRPEEVDYSIQNPGDAWFWHPDVEYLTATQLWNAYMLTVARGASLILNVPPNSSGLVPDNFITETRAFGKSIASLQPPVAVASVAPMSALGIGIALDLKLPLGAKFDTVVSSENLTAGQLIAAYTLELCSSPTSCASLRAMGGSVGHKVIDMVGNVTVNTSQTVLRFTPTKTTLPGYTSVQLASLSAYLFSPPPGLTSQFAATSVLK